LETHDLLLFLAFAGAAILAPGMLVQRLFRHEIDPALVVPLGGAFCAAAFWLSLWTGLGWLFPVLLAALVAAGLLLGGGPWGIVSGPSLRGAVPPALALFAVLAVAQYPWNRTDPATGEFMLDPLVTFDSPSTWG
jgi:hypothetical protein